MHYISRVMAGDTRDDTEKEFRITFGRVRRSPLAPILVPMVIIGASLAWPASIISWLSGKLK